MNAAQALAIAAAAYAIAMEQPLSASFELAQGGFEVVVERLEMLSETTLRGGPGFRAIPDGDCIEQWAGVR
jgi:hypothetical protein